MTTKPPAFTQETDLCAAFIAAVPRDWLCYAETGGWDILLVRRNDGCQIGIEAKLRLNAEVLCQAAASSYQPDQGPDYRAVLIPAGANNKLSGLASHCRLTVLRQRSSEVGYFQPDFSPGLPRIDSAYDNGDWHQMLPISRHQLPDYVPDVAAGAQAPLRLTQWKIAALKAAALLEATGYLTRQDFKRFGIDIRRWIGVDQWLQPGKDGFIAGPGFPNFREQHPKVWKQITAEPEKWARPRGLL